MVDSRLGRAAALLMVATILSACSGIEQKRLEYRQSQSIPPLEMPAGLGAPQSETALPVPKVNAASVGVDVSPPVDLPEALLTAPEPDPDPANKPPAGTRGSHEH